MKVSKAVLPRVPSALATARNAAFSGFALVFCSVLNFVFYGAFAAERGLTEYGLVILTRNLTVLGVFVLLDLGLGDAVAARIAGYRAVGEGSRARQVGSFGLALGAGLGVVMALAGWLLSAPLAALLLGSDPLVQPRFASAVAIVSLSLVIQLPGTIAEAVLRGLGHYIAVRMLDTLLTVIFSGGGLVLLGLGYGFEEVIGLLLAAIVVRFSIAIALALAALLRFERTNEKETGILRDLLGLARRAWHGKAVGTLNVHIVYLAAGVLAGAAAAGLVDLLMRGPRFALVFVNTVNQVIMPRAVGLERAGRSASVARDFRLVLVAAFTASLALPAAAGLAPDLLRIWSGDETTAYWPWFVALTVWPFASMIVSLGAMMLSGRGDFIQRNARLAWVQLLILLSVGAVAVNWLGAVGFLLAHLVATLALFPAQLALIGRYIEPVPSIALRTIGRGLLVGAPALALGMLFSATGWVHGWAELLVALLAAALPSWLLAPFLLADAAERNQLREILLRC